MPRAISEIHSITGEWLAENNYIETKLHMHCLLKMFLAINPLDQIVEDAVNPDAEQFWTGPKKSLRNT